MADYFSYWMEFSDQDSIPSCVRYLKAAIGRRIGEVRLDLYRAKEPAVISVFSKIWEGSQFSKMELCIGGLSDNYAYVFFFFSFVLFFQQLLIYFCRKFLLETANHCQVKELRWLIAYGANIKHSISNPGG